MIGNTVRYRTYLNGHGFMDGEGLVVDAYTEVSDYSKGEGILGFSASEGSTSSTRKYRVQLSTGGIIDIRANDVEKILTFGKTPIMSDRIIER